MIGLSMLSGFHMTVLTTNKALAEFVLELWRPSGNWGGLGTPPVPMDGMEVHAKKGSWAIGRLEEGLLPVWAIVDWKTLRIVGFTNADDMDGPWMGDER